jgi:hypothetical protein
MEGTQDQYAIVELMGRRSFGARIAEVEKFGAKFLQAEILMPGGDVVQQLVSPAALYAMTSCTEDQARAKNASNPWGLREAVPILPPPAPTIGARRVLDDGNDAECFDPCDRCGSCGDPLRCPSTSHESDEPCMCGGAE